ncbi:MAG TPA: signal peptidase II [Terriglobales bacterium]|nr:signal peptidase II [Terriglobales bacterium]
MEFGLIDLLKMRKYHVLIAALVVLLDRLTKWIIAQKVPLHDSITVVPGVFQLTHVQNQGAAFGLFSDSPSEWKVAMLILFSVAALAVVSALLWKNGNAMNATAIALSLVFGGALGNLWDRVASGRVIDFLDFYVGSHHWPAFNIADSAIVVGALLLLSEIFWAPQEETSKQQIG